MLYKVTPGSKKEVHHGRWRYKDRQTDQSEEVPQLLAEHIAVKVVHGRRSPVENLEGEAVLRSIALGAGNVLHSAVVDSEVAFTPANKCGHAEW